ncbi:MAG: hypothetical protein ACOYN3_07230 [Acidimicrobiia bacterium]
MVAVLVDEYRPAPRRSLLSAVDEYVAGPRVTETVEPTPVATPTPEQPARPRTVRPAPSTAQRTASTAQRTASTAQRKEKTEQRSQSAAQSISRAQSVVVAKSNSTPATAPTLPEVRVRADWYEARALAAPTVRRTMAPVHVWRSATVASPRTAAVEPVAANTPTRVSNTNATGMHSHSVYVRRRIAVAGIAIVIALFGWGLFSVLGGASLVASEHRPTTVTYLVRSGDSLWSVARHVAPNDDPRRVVADLERARGGAPLLPGETILWTRT